MKFSKISDCFRGSGEVKVRGWIHNIRKGKDNVFIILRDSSGVIQCVVDKGKSFFDTASGLSVESSIVVKGVVREDVRAPGGSEIKVEELGVVHKAERWPINRDKSTEFLMDVRHLWVRDPRLTMVWKVRSVFFEAVRDYFRKRGFYEVTGPVIVGTKGEEGGELFDFDYFGEKAYLSQTNQMHLEAMIFSLEKVYSLMPSFRAEKSRTRKHLTEFWHLEAEEAWTKLSGCLKTVEGVVSHSVKAVLKKCKPELEGLGADVKALSRVKPPFKRITYSKAIEKLQSKGLNISFGDDIKTDGERLLTEGEDKPLFVTHWPRSIKAFYMKVSDKDPELVECADLQAPNGFGEIVGGSEREEDIKVIIDNLKRDGDDPKKYDWYLDLRRYGSVPHSGFGLGTERVIRWICGLDHIRDSTPFPRFINRFKP